MADGTAGVLQLRVTPIPIHLALAGIVFADGPRPPRAMIEWAKADGVRGIVLDGTTLRARDLDRSARRDVAATLRRLDLRFGGIELWIPPAHFAEAAHVDRACAALAGACGLAAEVAGLLGEPTPGVWTEWPEKPHADAAALAAQPTAATIVDARVSGTPHGMTAAGVDPAACLLAGVDPVARTMSLAGRLGGARLGDAGSAGRCPVGAGRLNLDEYRVALAAAGARTVVLDLRGLRDAEAGRRVAVERWSG
jgi:sugar phosphate isomerase/epimerase